LKILDAVILALRTVWAQKLKSFFTLLGVIVGVTFLISVFAVVEGMNRYVQDDFAGSIFGINTITIERIWSGRGGRQDAQTRRRQSRNPDITTADAEALREEIPNIWYMAYNTDRFMPEVRSGQNKRKNVRLIGVTDEYLDLQDRRRHRTETVPGRVGNRTRHPAGTVPLPGRWRAEAAGRFHRCDSRCGRGRAVGCFSGRLLTSPQRGRRDPDQVQDGRSDGSRPGGG
jgi:hypothetical protein